uniref:Uncharacterized protein n=1 Tax=Cacopsylla melanoneura TaxID=428564 RepID=A0A8D9BKK4_9HEMI
MVQGNLADGPRSRSRRSLGFDQVVNGRCRRAPVQTRFSAAVVRFLVWLIVVVVIAVQITSAVCQFNFEILFRFLSTGTRGGWARWGRIGLSMASRIRAGHSGQTGFRISKSARFGRVRGRV